MPLLASARTPVDGPDRRGDRRRGAPRPRLPLATSSATVSPAGAANRAASEATGDVLIFCSHTATLPPNAGSRWVGELVAQATRAEIGAVSGTVVDEEGRLRHGGCASTSRDWPARARGTDLGRLSTGRPINPGGASGDLLAIRANEVRSRRRLRRRESARRPVRARPRVPARGGGLAQCLYAGVADPLPGRARRSRARRRSNISGRAGARGSTGCSTTSARRWIPHAPRWRTAACELRDVRRRAEARWQREDPAHHPPVLPRTTTPGPRSRRANGPRAASARPRGPRADRRSEPRATRA